MQLLRKILVGLFLLLFVVTAGAQEVFVKNQRFAGKVVRESGQLWLELEPLGKALGFTAEVETQGARIDGRLVRIITQGPVVLVSLSQVAGVVGAVVKENPDFGTIDIYSSVRERTGEGLDVDTTASTTKADVINTAAFSFSLPEGMQVSRDPRLIKSYLSGGGPGLNSNIKVDALVFYKGDTTFQKGAALFSWFVQEVPKEVTEERALLAFQYQSTSQILEDLHVELVQPPKVLSSSGQSFVLAAGIDRAPPHDGMIVLSRIDAKRKRFYQVITGGVPQDQEQPTVDFLKLMSTVTAH